MPGAMEGMEVTDMEDMEEDMVTEVMVMDMEDIIVATALDGLDMDTEVIMDGKSTAWRPLDHPSSFVVSSSHR